MKPSKKSGVPRESELRPARGEAGEIGGTRSDDDVVEGIDGEEGNGGAYGRPRPSDEDEKSDRSRERG